MVFVMKVRMCGSCDGGDMVEMRIWEEVLRLQPSQNFEPGEGE